jgi:hypothetical protein
MNTSAIIMGILGFIVLAGGLAICFKFIKKGEDDEKKDR